MATDVILLEVGDTTVPFANHEGDTHAYCRGLADAFRYLGVDTELSETIVDTIGHKPTLVQKVFLLRVVGMKQQEIAETIGTNQQEVSRCIRQRCRDVRAILRRYVKPQPYEELGDIEVPASLRN